MIDPNGSPRSGPSRSRAFDHLQAMVSDAKQGDIRLPLPATGPPDTPRLPASWYSRAQPAVPDFNRDMLRAGAIGGLTGLIIVLPLLFWRASSPTHLALEPGEATLSLVAAQSRDVALSPALAPADRMRALIELARLRILAGDVLAARTVLSRADVARDANALFLMAETYDLRRLEAWGVRVVEADEGRARALYAAANALGHAGAEERLAALGQ
jgi:hypothetical protein